jgi:DNA modification methylase
VTVRILQGDVRKVLRDLPDESVGCCVTSPPYFGLRDSGCADQIGLEETPEAFVAELVAVFREVRRVLRKDGTLWLNIGDSYAGSWGAQSRDHAGKHAPNVSAISAKQIVAAQRKTSGTGSIPKGSGLKPKDLMGIPWALATALRDPYYTGRIKSERDRAWLAAIIDGEGSISGYEHTRRDNGGERTGLNICVTNTNAALLNECSRIWPASTHNHVPAGAGHLGSRRVDRWIPSGAADKAQLLEELFPYLIAKKKQAIVGWNLAQAMMRGKSDGHLPGAEEARARRVRLVAMLRALNSGDDVALPSWLIEPPSPYRPGWYLRQEIIWAKAQSGDDRGGSVMPESVTDRCTKAHEQVFLLTKSPTYYFDADAIAEPILTSDADAARAKQTGRGRQPAASHYLGAAQRDHSGGYYAGETANRRSVWRINTQPFGGAHFATMPPALVELCLLAGCREGDTVLDPFGGAGTTGLVADRMHRDAVLIELNPEYVEIARQRIAGDSPLFANVAA